MSDFFAQYKRPEWQKKRLEVMEAAGFMCVNCGSTDKTLNVHHKYYIKDRKPWEYDNENLRCLCDECHKQFHDSKQELLSLIDIGGCNIDFVLGFAKAAAFNPDYLPLPIVDHEQARGSARYLGWGDEGADDLIELAMLSPDRTVSPEVIDLIGDAKLISGCHMMKFVVSWRLMERGFNPHQVQELFSEPAWSEIWYSKTVTLSDGLSFTLDELEAPIARVVQ